jgi:hypothetical protein
VKLRDKQNKKPSVGGRSNIGHGVYYNDDYDDDDDYDVSGENDDEDQEDELKIYNDARRARRKKRKARRTRIVVLILFMLLVALVCLNWNVLAPPKLAQTVRSFMSSFGKSKYPVYFEQGSMKTAVQLGSDVGVLTDTSFLIYSQTGDLLAVRPHGFNNPAAVSGGGEAVIFDRGGKQFRVETRLAEPYSATAADTITTAAASDSGDFAIVTESQDYLSELTVYDTSYKDIFKWDASQGRILSAAISPDGSKLAAIAVGARNGNIFSDIYIFDLNSQKPVSVKEYDGEMLFSINFKDNNQITAEGEDKTVFLNSSGSQTSTYTYTDKQLVCSSNADGPAVLVFGGVGTNTSVVSLDGSGKVLGQATVKAEVTTASTSGGNIVLGSRGGIWCAYDNCTGISNISVSGDVLTTLFNKGYVYIFGTQSVERYNLR